MEKERVRQIVEEVLEGYPSLFAVDCTLSSDNDIRIILDGDQGVDIETVIAVSRAIERHPAMDREKEDFSLSVSSPGADSPLRTPRQYAKHLGRELDVQTVRGEEYTGELTDCGQESITLQWSAREPKPVGKGKRTVIHTREIPFADIRKAVVRLKI